MIFPFWELKLKGSDQIWPQKTCNVFGHFHSVENYGILLTPFFKNFIKSIAFQINYACCKLVSRKIFASEGKFSFFPHCDLPRLYLPSNSQQHLLSILWTSLLPLRCKQPVFPIFQSICEDRQMLEQVWTHNLGFEILLDSKEREKHLLAHIYLFNFT